LYNVAAAAATDAVALPEIEATAPTELNSVHGKAATVSAGCSIEFVLQIYSCV
jgi:hypothetical protein